jgi:hypothetical protein
LHLHIDTSGTISNNPVLLVDGGLPQFHQNAELLTTGCHEIWSAELKQEPLTPKRLTDIASTVYFKLLSPFADVFCFFAADLGGLRPIIKQLAAWLDLTKTSLLPESSRPQVVIVTDGVGDETCNLRTFMQMLANETSVPISKNFSNIRLVSPNFKRNNFNKQRYWELKECLRTSLCQTRTKKIEDRTLFTSRHFAAFFYYARQYAVGSSKDPFNFITSSRQESPVAEGLPEHLVNFLRNMQSSRQVQEFAVPAIASSFVLDNYYPPSMHGNVYLPVWIYTANKPQCLIH